jgi:hypothetical protein
MSGNITLNGTTFHPSDIAKETSKIGVALVAASGRRRFVHRTSSGTPIYKRTWTLPFDNVSETVRLAVAAIYALTTTFTFVDEHGTSYTVQCEDGGYSEKINTIVSNTELTYDLTLKVLQT